MPAIEHLTIPTIDIGKITFTVSDFSDEVLDAIAEKVAAKMREPIVIHVHPGQVNPAPQLAPRYPLPAGHVWC